jgi:two-component system response regulator DegU
VSIRILIVEDQTIVREGLRRLLETEPSLEVVAEAEDVASAVAASRAHRPDVILMDLKLGLESGLDATRQILHENPDARILALTAYDDYPMIEAATMAGVLGYAPKQIAFAQLMEAIATVYKGAKYIHPSLAASLMEGIRHQAAIRTVSRPPLTAEESELLRLMAEGLSYADIAARIFVSERTVRRRIQTLLDKLEVVDRVQAVAMAIRHGWL